MTMFVFSLNILNRVTLDFGTLDRQNKTLTTWDGHFYHFVKFHRLKGEQSVATYMYHFFIGHI